MNKGVQKMVSPVNSLGEFLDDDTIKRCSVQS